MSKFKNADHLLSMKPFIEYSNNVDEEIKIKLNNITDEFEKKDIYNKTEMLQTLLKYSVNGSWVEKFNKSQKFGRDSNSLESHIARYGKEIGKMLFEKKAEECKVTKDGYIDKYGKKEGLEKWDELCKSKATFTPDYYIDKYGKKEGLEKWDEVLTKKLKTQKENFRNKKWHNGRTLEEYQERYGVAVGYDRWSERNRIQSYKVSKERYIDEYGDEMGREICRKIKDNTSLNAFVERYGEEKGRERYKENCKKYGITVEKMIEKYGEVDGKRKYNEWYNKCSSAFDDGYSNSSQNLFWHLYESLDKNIQDECYFGELNEEWKFYQYKNEICKLIRVDFKYKNKIIEFDCEYWHDEEEDKKRDLFLNSKGYSILRIKYKDYIHNMNKELDKCLEFIYE